MQTYLESTGLDFFFYFVLFSFWFALFCFCKPWPTLSVPVLSHIYKYIYIYIFFFFFFCLEKNFCFYPSSIYYSFKDPMRCFSTFWTYFPSLFTFSSFISPFIFQLSQSPYSHAHFALKPISKISFYLYDSSWFFLISIPSYYWIKYRIILKI